MIFYSFSVIFQSDNFGKSLVKIGFKPLKHWKIKDSGRMFKYWCDTCDIPIFENVCPSCGTEGKYIATDVRPEFPEENALISLIIGDNLTKLNKLPLFH